MLRFEFLNLTLGTMLLRYYLMMAVVIAAGFLGNWWIALLALPIFLSTILGVVIKFGKDSKSAKHMNMNTGSSVRKAS